MDNNNNNNNKYKPIEYILRRADNKAGQVKHEARVDTMGELTVRNFFHHHTQPAHIGDEGGRPARPDPGLGLHHGDGLPLPGQPRPKYCLASFRFTHKMVIFSF